MFKPETKTLIIFSMITMRKIIAKHLKELGFHNLHEAYDGKEAWQSLIDAATENKPFELVMSDWTLPELSGIELLKICRVDQRFKNLPFILVTPTSQKSQVFEALKLKVSNYIVTPFTSEQFKQKLEEAYKNHEQMEARTTK